MTDTSSIVFRDIENVLRRARTDVSKALRAYHRTASHASLTTPASASGASSASNASGGVSGGREDTAARQTAARRDASPSPATSFSSSVGQGGTHSNPSITGGQRATSVVDFVAIFAEHNLISDQCLSASRDTVAAALSNGRTGTNSGYWQPPVRPLSASDRLSASGPIFQQQKPASASTEQRSDSAISETVSSTAHCPAGQANTTPAEGPLASGSGRGGGTGGGKPVVVSYGGHRGTDYWVSNSGLSRSVAASSDTSGKIGVTQSSSSTVSNVDRSVGYYHQQRSASLGRLSSDRANNVVEPPFYPQQQQQQAKQGTPSLLSSATRQQLAAKHSLGNADNRRKQDWFENRRQSLERLNGTEAASSLNSSGSRAWSVGSSQSQRANSCLNVNTAVSSAVHQHQQPEAPVQPAVRWPTQSTTGVVVGHETAAIGPSGPAFSCLDNMSSSRVAAINSKKQGAGGNARGNGRAATATAETDRSAAVTSCPQQRPFLGDTVLQKSAFRPVQTRNKSATNGAPSDVQSQGQGQGRFSVTSMSSLQQQTSAVAAGVAPAPQQRGRTEGRSAGPVVGRHSLALDKPLPLAASLSPWTLQAADRTEELNDIANGIMPVSIASTGRLDASKSSVMALASEFQRRASADPAYNRTVFDLSLSPRATNAATLAVKREGSERLLGEKRRLKTRRQRSLERSKALSTRLLSNNSVDILNLAGAMMARRNSSDDSSDDSGAEKRLSLKKAPPEQKDIIAVDASASITMASIASIKSTSRRKQQLKNGNRNSTDLKSSSLGDTENVNRKSLSPRLQQQIQQQQRQLLLDHSVDSSPSLDDSLQEVLGDLLPANELLLAASHSYDARSSAAHLMPHDGVKMVDSSVSPVFNAIPVTVATYTTQPPSLPVVQLNVLPSTDHHRQMQMSQVRLINSATSPPMIKVIEPGMVSNLPQQHSQSKQPVVNSSTKMLQVDNYGPPQSAASASPSSSPVSYVSHFATVPRYYKEYSLPAPSSALSQQQQQQPGVTSNTGSVMHHHQPGNDGSKHYPEQRLRTNESHPSAGSSVSHVSVPQLRTAALELWDASVDQQQQSTANTRDALMLVPAGGQRSRRESMVSSSTQTDVPDLTSIPTDDKCARNVAAKAGVETSSVTLAAEDQCVALSPVPVTTLSAASRTDDVEVAEACQWLRAAGFPQYARMYEDSLTPINLEEAAIDHHFLASQQLDCLISRLRVLNRPRAAKPLTVKSKTVQGQSSAVGGGEEEEPSLALSSQWKYEPATRHWTRSPSTSPTTENGPNIPLGDGGKLNNNHIHSHHYSNARQMSVSPLADDVFIATKSPSTSSATRDSHNAFPSVAAVNGHLAKPKADSERTQGLVSPDTVHNSNSRTVNGHGHGSVAKNGSEHNVMFNGNHLTDKRQMATAVSADQLSDVNAVVLRNQYFDAAKDTRTQPHKQSQDAQLLDLFDDDMLLLMGEKPRPKLHTYDAKTLPNRKSNTPKRDSNGHGVSMTSLALHSSGSNRQGTDLLLGIQPKPDYIGMNTERRNSSEAASSTATVSAADVMTASSSSVSNNQTQQPISSDTGGDMHKRNFAVNAANRQSVYDNFSSKVSTGGAQHELDVILQQLLESASSLHVDDDDGAPNAGFHGNTSLNTGTGVFGLHPIPIDIDLIADERGTVGQLTENKQNMDVKSLQSSSPCKGGLQVDVVDDIILASGKVKDAAHDECSKDEASPSSDSGLPSSCSQNSSSAVTGIDERLSRDIDSSLERSDDTCDMFAECNLSDNTLLTESNNTIHEDAQRNAHGVSLASLSAGQLVLARQLCLLQLTSLLEHRDHTLSVSALPTSNPAKAKMSASARVFGVTLDSVERTTGQSLLPCISTLMNHLHTVRTEAVGLFRRPGVHSQVLELKQQLEKCSDVNLLRYQPYDVADVLRHFYRDLSECLMTDRISAICISLYRNLPASEHLATLRMALVLLPDAHLASLRQLLFLLRSIAQQSSVNQMTTVNLAICFAPSIFRLWEPAADDPSIRTGMPTERQLKEQQAAQQCLVDMINCTDEELFVVPYDVMSDINKNASVAVLPKQVSSTRLQEILSFAEDLLQSFVRDMKTQYSWTSVFTVNGIDVAYRQLTDVCIPLWRVTAAEIEAPPSEVLSRIVADRSLWEEGFVQGRVLFKVDQQTDVFQHSTRVLPVLYGHDVVCSFCELRSWRTGLANGACALVCTSVVYGSGGQSQGHAGGRQGNVLASHYFIQPCGAGKSSLIHLAQIDFGGLSPMWYKRCYSQVCAQRVRRICEQFQRRDEFGDVPETPL